MRVRISFLVVMLAIGSVGAVGQSGAASNGSSQAPDATPGSKDNPARVSTGVMMRLILHKVDPIYPEDAKKNHVSGAVVVAATVDDQGNIVTASVVSGPEKLRHGAECCKSVDFQTLSIERKTGVCANPICGELQYRQLAFRFFSASTKALASLKRTRSFL
jgi:hypothetical protein